MLRRLAALLTGLVLATGAQAATKAERCARYQEQLARVEAAKRRGGSEAHQHKLEAQRQKILAGQAKYKC